MYTNDTYDLSSGLHPLKLGVKAAMEGFRNFFKMNIKYAVKFLTLYTLKSLFSGPGKVTPGANPAFLLYKCQHKCFKTAENWSVPNCLEKAELQSCV